MRKIRSLALKNLKRAGGQEKKDETSSNFLALAKFRDKAVFILSY
jgi:hypothetical protein